MSAEPCLSLAAIDAALSRCMDAHPPQGMERTLHPDADAIASKWGLMRYLGESELALRGLDETFLAAFGRWHVSSETNVVSQPPINPPEGPQ